MTEVGVKRQSWNLAGMSSFGLLPPPFIGTYNVAIAAFNAAIQAARSERRNRSYVNFGERRGGMTRLWDKPAIRKLTESGMFRLKQTFVAPRQSPPKCATLAVFGMSVSEPSCGHSRHSGVIGYRPVTEDF